MSTSQQGYSWTQSFVFLETRNGEKVELVRLVADLSLLSPPPPPQCGAEFERTVCRYHVGKHQRRLVQADKILYESVLATSDNEFTKF